MRLAVQLSDLYPEFAQRGLFQLSAFADGEHDPIEGFVAVGADNICCDTETWGGSDATECRESRGQYICTSAAETDCYHWGSSDEFLNMSAAGTITAYRFGASFPCETLYNEFDTAVSLIEGALGAANVTLAADALTAFINTLSAPEMTALVLVDASSNVVFMQVESLNVMVGSEDKIFNLDEHGYVKPYTTGGALTLPVGELAYTFMNDVVLADMGGVVGIIIGPISEELCKHTAPFRQTCAEKINELAMTYVEATLIDMAAQVQVELATLDCEPFAQASACVMGSAATGEVTATYEVITD